MSKKMTLLMATMFVVVLAFFAQTASQAQTSYYVQLKDADAAHSISLQIAKTDASYMGQFQFADNTNRLKLYSGLVKIGSLTPSTAVIYCYTPYIVTPSDFTTVVIDKIAGTESVTLSDAYGHIWYTKTFGITPTAVDALNIAP